MIKKTDKYLNRTSRIWERGHITNDKAIECVRRETWWLLWLLPLYSRDTVTKSNR